MSGIGFSPDGLRIVTASEDQTARVWDVAPESRSPTVIAAVLRCHVPYRLDEEGRLLPATPDPSACPPRQPRDLPFDRRYRASNLIASGRLALASSHLSLARSFLEEARSLYHSLSDAAAEASVLLDLGDLDRSNNPAAARAHYQTARALFETVHDPAGVLQADEKLATLP